MGQEGSSSYDSEAARLERRLKRRSKSNRYFEKKSNRNALTVMNNNNKNQAKESLELVEYGNFMSSGTYDHGDYSGSYVDEDNYWVSDHEDVGGDHYNQDPQYEMFLNNVKQDGQSYALVVSQKNNVPELLRYERVDLEGDDDECGEETPEAIKSYPANQSGKGERILRKLSYGENTEISNSRTNFSSDGDVLSLRTKRYQARNDRKREILETLDSGASERTICLAERSVGRESSERSGLGGKYLIECHIGHEGDADDVPSEIRKGCLAQRRAGKEHREPISGGTSLRSGSESEQLVDNEFYHDDATYMLSERRKSCLAGRRAVNERRDPKSGGTSLRSGSESRQLNEDEFDHEDDDNDDNDDEIPEDFSRLLNSGYGGIGSEGDFLNRRPNDHEDEVDEDYFRFLNFDSGQRSHQEGDIDDENEYYGLVNTVCGGTNGQINTRPCSRNSHWIEHEHDQEEFSDDIDQEYLTFLDWLEMEGEATMYKIDNSPERFDEVEESESDVELIVMDKDPYSGEATTPFVSSRQCEHIDIENYSLAEDPSIRCSQFKKGLMEVLKKPYDSKEHESLKKEVSHRKPIFRERVMRHSTKSYPVEHKLGKSYLDLYSDLAKQLDQAKNDDRKSLNLLRGFFYWLKNITLDKGFMPWRDPSCLEVLPPVTGKTRRIFKSKCK